MRRRTLLVFPFGLGLFGQRGRRPPEAEDEDVKLPNGKSQRTEIIKAEHKKSVADAGNLARLASEVRDELESGSADVVSLKTLKKLDDMEKLVRTIRGRLKRL